ncbi:hypothetical protein POL68_32000 [Stigmatella sp. ncwal1]|uniref:Lipoprotein n=1 Tax=Stigmatella ashevillensis TaxID=2995309 RepID=A0ABT5DHK6_9BACT|nr:hypothetical protein [Stigmatella ashevillena]MDC0713130.1 hypothetical protein [Stigmatella ashevillena]
MKRSLATMLVFVGLSLLGCGGPVTEPETAPDTDAPTTVSQLSTCTASCPGGTSVSCTGASCSATDNQGVTCGGTFYACGCGNLPACSAYSNKICTSPGQQLSCCNNGHPDALLCSSAGGTTYRWYYF